MLSRIIKLTMLRILFNHPVLYEKRQIMWPIEELQPSESFSVEHVLLRCIQAALICLLFALLICWGQTQTPRACWPADRPVPPRRAD